MQPLQPHGLHNVTCIYSSYPGKNYNTDSFSMSYILNKYIYNFIYCRNTVKRDHLATLFGEYPTMAPQ